MTAQTRWEHWRGHVAISAIALIALSLRFWGAMFDLPYIYHPDEPQIIVAIQDMLANHDANPHLFLYPSLLYYVNVLAALVFEVLPAWLMGNSIAFSEPISEAMGATFAPDANSVALYRGVSIALGVGCVYVAYALAKRERNFAAGLVAASLLAISPLLVTHSRYVTPDGYVVFFELLAMMASCAILRSGRHIDYVWAGVAIGAAAASKYNGAVVCILPIAAHILRAGWSPKSSGPLWWSAAASLVAFFVLNPFILIDHESVMGVIYQFHTYSSRHGGMEGNSPWWYLQELWAATGIALILAVLQILAGVRRREPFTIVLGSFALVYFAFIGSFTVRNDRTLLPIVPCVQILASIYLVDFGSDASPLRRMSPAFARATLAILALAVFVPPLLATANQARALTTVDSRSSARDWINSQIPEGSLIFLESYAPFVDPFRFRTAQAERAIDHQPRWYVDNDVDYVVLSEGMFGRYFKDSKRYAPEVVRYVQLMDSMTQVKQFDDGGYVISIYKTKKQNAEPRFD